MGLGPLFFARAFPCWVLWCSDSLTSPIFRSFFEILQLRWGGGVLDEFETFGGKYCWVQCPRRIWEVHASFGDFGRTAGLTPPTPLDQQNQLWRGPHGLRGS